MTLKTIKIFIYLFLILFFGYNYGVKTYFHYQEHEESLSLYQSISSDNIPWTNLGYSTLGNSIYLLDIGGSEEITLVIGGIHGDEFGSFNLAYRLGHFLNDEPNAINKRAIIIPLLNPDGLLKDTRTNSNGVDIDKNFPSRNWSPVYQDNDAYPGSDPASETESLLLMDVLNRYKPNKIIALHSNQNNISFGGPAQGLANKIAQLNGYEVIYNQQNPGSIEEYLGRDLNISCVNINLPSNDPEQNWLENKGALISAINY